MNSIVFFQYGLNETNELIFSITFENLMIAPNKFFYIEDLNVKIYINDGNADELHRKSIFLKSYVPDEDLLNWEKYKGLKTCSFKINKELSKEIIKYWDNIFIEYFDIKFKTDYYSIDIIQRLETKDSSLFNIFRSGSDTFTLGMKSLDLFKKWQVNMPRVFGSNPRKPKIIERLQGQGGQNLGPKPAKTFDVITPIPNQRLSASGIIVRLQAYDEDFEETENGSYTINYNSSELSFNTEPVNIPLNESVTVYWKNFAYTGGISFSEFEIILLNTNFKKRVRVLKG